MELLNKSYKKIRLRFSKKGRTRAGRIADIGGIIALFVMIFGWVNLSNQISNLEQKIDGNTAESTLLSYFSEIENNNLTGAYNLLSDQFKQGNSYEGFYNRLHDIVGFEGLQITELTGKNTAIQRVYLVEFGFKKRGKIPLDSKRGTYVRYNNGKREINANSILYENGRKPTACEFYTFEHCK